MKKTLLYILILFFLFIQQSCINKKNKYSYQNKDKTITIELVQLSDTNHTLRLSVNDSLHSEWKLDYPVFHMDFGDIDNNESPEILVGVIKTTRFDPHLNKRLFIFKITENLYIRPKWLGSRLGQPLEDFKLIIENGLSFIKTIEKEKDGTYLVCKYKWRGFGLEFVEYVARNISQKKAESLLNN